MFNKYNKICKQNNISDYITVPASSVSYDYGYVIWGLTQVNLTSGTIVSGDSGGPCYFSNKISGVISGKSGSTTMYYSPILTGAFTVKTS